MVLIFELSINCIAVVQLLYYLTLHLRHFEDLICKLLDTYYNTSKEMTKKVLRKEIPLWNNQTVVEVAGSIGLKKIFGNQGCQMVLKEDWKEVGLKLLSVVYQLPRKSLDARMNSIC